MNYEIVFTVDGFDFTDIRNFKDAAALASAIQHYYDEYHDYRDFAIKSIELCHK